MSTPLNLSLLEKAKTYIGKELNCIGKTITLKEVREIDNDGKPMILAYSKELNYPVNFAILRDKEGNYII